MKNRGALAAKYCSITVGAALVILAVIYNLTSNFTVGTVFCYLLGGILLAYGIFHKRLSRVLPKWFKAFVVFCYIFVAVFASSVFICGGNDNVTYKEDVIIVLGAGIKGEKIGTNLQKRLDTALDYHRKNPSCIIVVSGGQGPYEDITEALAMERYLVSNGVPAENIIKEERSTSTKENFAFSKSILDDRFGENGYTAAYITNGYHIYRAGLFAESAGFKDISHLHAETPWYTAVPNGIREMLGILTAWVFGVG